MKPSEIKELIIDPADEPCVQWKKLLKAVYLWYLVRRYEDAESGELGTQFAADVCAQLNDCEPAATT